MSVLARARELARYLRVTRFDTSNAQGRGDERTRRVLVAAGGALLARVLVAGANLLMVPLTLRHLGPERFGLWMALSSLVLTASFADLGIGNGLLGAVSRATGRPDGERLTALVSSALFSLSIVGAIAMLLFVASTVVLPWSDWFAAKDASLTGEVLPTLFVLVLAFALAMPLGTAGKVLEGLQEGGRAALWTALGSALSLVFAAVAIANGAGLPALVVALSAGNLLALLVCSFVELGIRIPQARPQPSAISLEVSKSLLLRGSLFMLIQACATLAYATDAPILINRVGGAEAATYSVTARLCGLITLVLGTMLSPLWSAYGEAIARGDEAWVRMTLARSTRLALATSSVAGLAIILFGRHVVKLWTGNAEVLPPISLLTAMAIWGVLVSWGSATTAFLNGAQLMRFQSVTAVATVALSIPLRWMVAPAYGATGVVAANCAVYTLTAVIPVLLLKKSLLASVAKGASANAR